MFDAAVINFVVFIFGIMLLQAFYHLEAGREHPTFSITSEMPWAYLIESIIMTSATWSARDMLPDKCLSLGAKTVTIWFSNSLFGTRMDDGIALAFHHCKALPYFQHCCIQFGLLYFVMIAALFF